MLHSQQLLIRQGIRRRLTQIVSKRTALWRKPTIVSEEQDVGKEEILQNAGPLYKLLRPQKVNRFPPDITGNILKCLKEVHEQQLYRKDYGITHVFTKYQRRLENMEDLSSRDILRLMDLFGQKGIMRNASTQELFLNMVLYNVEYNKNETVNKELLLVIADGIIDGRPKDFNIRSMINYSLMIEALEKQNYFDRINSREIYRIVYQPFISPLNVENYIKRVQTMEYALEFADMHKDRPSERKGLLGQMKTDLVGTLAMAIEMEDFSKVEEFYVFLQSNYDELKSEDFHNLLHVSLEHSDYDMLQCLIDNNNHLYKNLVSTIPILEKVKIAQIYANKGDIDKFLKYNVFDKSHTESYERSKVVEVFFNANMPIRDVYKLLNEITPEDGVHDTRDYEFLVDWMMDPLKDLEAVTSEDLHQNLDNELLEDPDINDNVKTLYMNLYLKALSGVTNISGIIRAYCLLPLELVNRQTFQILFHALSADPMRRPSTTVELFKFSQNHCNLTFSEKEYAILIGNCFSLDRTDFDFKQLVYYLYSYFKRSDTRVLPNKISTILFTEHIDTSYRQIRNQPERIKQFTSDDRIAQFLLRLDGEIMEDHVDFLDQLRSGHVIKQMKREGVEFKKSLDDYFFQDYIPGTNPLTQSNYDDHDADMLKLKHVLYTNPQG